MPALLTRWSIRPWAATTAATAASTAAASPTSTARASARPPARGDRRGHGLELVRLDVDEDDRGALGGQVPGDGLADALGRAGDDRYPAFESHHPPTPLKAWT